MKRAFPLLLLVFFCSPVLAFAQSTSNLQAQIDQHNKQIVSLEVEIAQYQAQLDTLSKQKSTLQSAINALTLSQKQLTAQLSVTRNKIASATLELNQLSLAIGAKESSIAADEAAIAKALREVAQGEQASLVEQVFNASSLSDAWTAADQSTQFNRALDSDIANLASARTELANNRDAVSTTKAQLVSLQHQLTVQKKSIDASKAGEQALLRETNNQESSYQKLLAQKRASEIAFEQELLDLQSQLNLIVHPGFLPKVGSGVLSWPFSLSFMQSCASRSSVFGNPFCITQYFGNTPFSTANPQIYSGHGHDGVDIGAPIGTPVVVALSGIVLGTGNTDVVRGCYSFGKWVMVKHPDGLSTMYAHLSEIDVSTGQAVLTGEVLGYSGMTGYATGPHLHFGVYATEGTKILALGQFKGFVTPCANATMPVATLDAYLNPLSYL